jgi:hypothetical protein
MTRRAAAIMEKAVAAAPFTVVDLPGGFPRHEDMPPGPMLVDAFPCGTAYLNHAPVHHLSELMKPRWVADCAAMAAAADAEAELQQPGCPT